MNAKAIDIVNQKGGVGETTIGTNLDIGLAQEDKKDLIINCDT